MGEIGFTSFQKLVFDKISQEKSLRETFYFGGGTALSVACSQGHIEIAELLLSNKISIKFVINLVPVILAIAKELISKWQNR